jgi:hypothetical protein
MVTMRMKRRRRMGGHVRPPAAPRKPGGASGRQSEPDSGASDIFLGAETPADLHERYNRLRAMMPIAIEPLSADPPQERRQARCRPGWRIATITKTVLTSTSSDFELKADLDAFEGDKRVYCRSWDSRIPRDFV